MTAATYYDALARLLAHEGGYSDHPRDPGGPTNFGITIHDYRKYVDPGATAADVRAMPVETAKRIYRQKYWNVQRCDELPAGVDYAVFDYGVNSGIGRSGKVLRRLLGITDAAGAVTDEVIAAARRRDPKVLAAAICDERLVFLRSLSTWPVFGNGWGRRVREVRAAALAMAGASQGVVPSEAPSDAKAPGRSRPSSSEIPPWLARMNAILGLYEFAGGADNPAIIAMAKACGGDIARSYRHDATPWCALTENYVLVSCGLPGNDSLWALDFRNYGVKLPGPAVGAIATKHRQPSGGHVFNVVGRTAGGLLVGRGGNQSDMVCDALFDPDECRFNWPAQYPKPARVGLAHLPVVAPAPRARRDVVLPPPTRLVLPGKGTVPAPKLGGKAGAGAGAGGVAAGTTFWDWIAAHPWEAAAIGVAGGIIVIGGAAYLADRWQRAKQDGPTPALVPVAA